MSSIRPHSFSTITTSSIRIGSVNAIWIPAIRFLSAGCAAAPSASPASPAEAISVTPMLRTLGMLISIRQNTTSPSSTTPTR